MISKFKRGKEHNNKIDLGNSLVMEDRGYPSLDQFIKNNFDFSEGESDGSILLS